MRRVIIESPYAGLITRNVGYARKAIRHSLSLGEAPIASHLLYTQPGVLDDDIFAERVQGMMAGLSWYPAAEAIVFYIDFGMSPGMKQAEAYAKGVKPLEYRTILWGEK